MGTVEKTSSSTMLTKILVAAVAVASVSGAAIDAAELTPSSHIHRRGLPLCFKGCGDNGRKKSFWRILECVCHPGFDGACCDKCSVPEIPTKDIDLDEWTRASWYVQKQQVNGFQSADDLFCVVATYSLEGTRLFFNPNTDVIDVSNYGNSGRVNGPVQGGTENGRLCGRVTDEAGKLRVAPCFLPNFLAGPYWVAGLGETDGKYDWAVIIGGQPREFAPDGKCTTSLDDINNSGLWFFSREPVAPAEQIRKMNEVIEGLGVSGALLIDVPQQGCLYEGATIKPNN